MISVAFAQPATQTFPRGVPPGANPESGARPGNEIGTGSSLPLSEKSGNISPANTRSILAPNLPAPRVVDSAPPRDYLIAARAALAAGRTGEAQEALERAETRALDRSVPHLQTSAPIKDPMVAQIQTALHTLSLGDHARALQQIDAAISFTGQPGPA
jgi:hypothetical protein